MYWVCLTVYLFLPKNTGAFLVPPQSSFKNETNHLPLILGAKDTIGGKETSYRDVVRSREFIDKTMLIKHILEGRRRIFIEAPPGFGKTTNLQMLKEFLEMKVNFGGYSINSAKMIDNYKTFERQRSYSSKDNRNTVENVKTDSEEDKINYGTFGNYETFANPKLRILEEAPDFFITHFARYPVIYVDFGTLIVETFQDFVVSLQDMLKILFSPFRYLLRSNRLTSTAKDEFSHFWNYTSELSINEVALGAAKLSQLLSAHHHRQAVVLVDNFDAPIRKAILAPEIDDESFDGIFGSIVQFASNLVDSKYVTMTVLTGCLRMGVTDRLAHYSIFEDERLFWYYGLTEDDVIQLANRFNRNQHVQDIKQWYGGYYASRTGVQLYNTFSTVNYIKTGALKPYRDESRNMRILKNLLGYDKAGRDVEDSFNHNTRIFIRQKIRANDLKQLRRAIFDSKQFVEMDLVLQFLLDCGFFTVEDSNKLLVPNHEVELDLKNLLFDRNYYISKLNITDKTIDGYVKSIKRLNVDEASYTNFSAAVSGLFKYRVPRSSQELAHTLRYLAAESCKFTTVREEGVNSSRQDVLVRRADGTGIVVGVMSGATNDDALRDVFLRCFQVFKDCKAKIGLLLGLQRRGLRGELTVSYMYDNRSLTGAASSHEPPQMHKLNATADTQSLGGMYRPAST